MAIEVITREDLYEFRNILLEEIRTLLEGRNNPQQKWIKSPDVRKIFNISRGTLQNLRLNGTLPYTKIGGIIYYDVNEVELLLSKNKVNTASASREI
ncbi:helix-turn-helix domain-containing protein [Flavobacterium sp.]|uniref:helix-turn-helix domain-containing protein n=1 Tax=Flavobacterium sp. TaxID=239 RepID=UPI00120CBDB5|nr:helix-turn-helix domain-containing protein [Flavobacterium sp.]RZJ71729.1 MAG: DNA-binding protein [Flavobacterium sp.]